jgi:ABC-type transporter Mla MlaB component
MTNKKKDKVIGFDPLAWMKDDGHPSSIVGRSSAPATGDPAPTVQAGQGPSTSRTADAPGAVALGEALTIEQVTTMHAELGRHLVTGTVALEAAMLQRIDAAGLQLLTAFVRAAEGRGATIEWRAPSMALRDAARRAGLTAALHLA